MRKSKRPPPHPQFEFVRDVLPETAKKLAATLRSDAPELAAEVANLRIYGRCPCGSPNCGTFYCVPPDEYKKLVRFGSERRDPVTVAKGRIIRVETLDAGVDAILDQLFPDPNNGG